MLSLSKGNFRLIFNLLDILLGKRINFSAAGKPWKGNLLCSLTDFYTYKWKQSIEVTSPETSIFSFSHMKNSQPRMRSTLWGNWTRIQMLALIRWYFFLDLITVTVCWKGRNWILLLGSFFLLLTASKTCNQSCLDNTDINLYFWVWQNEGVKSMCCFM